MKIKKKWNFDKKWNVYQRMKFDQKNEILTKKFIKILFFYENFIFFFIKNSKSLLSFTRSNSLKYG